MSIHAGLPSAAVDSMQLDIRSVSALPTTWWGAYSYLASDSRWTTGSAIVVNGGYSAP